MSQSYKTAPETEFQMPITSPGCHLGFWFTSYRSQVPKTLFLGLINLLEQHIELRETFYLLDYHFIVKGYYLVQPDGKDK